jgi:PAS domain-containing protein
MVREAAADESGARLADRLQLLEGFLARTEIADCAEYGLQWAAETLGVRQSLCLMCPSGEQTMVVLASRGLRSAAAASFWVSLDDWSNPLVTALNSRRQVYYPAVQSAADRRRRPSTPFEDAAFHVVPLGRSGYSSDPSGLLLVSGQPSISPDMEWFATVFSQKLDQTVSQRTAAEGDRKQGRERSLLYSIINAVTDPILLTDTEGRLLIANARALTLFTASEEESEGRRSAVRMNNMLLSSALSSKAIEETGATRRELLLVNPVDGSDLLF